MSDLGLLAKAKNIESTTIGLAWTSTNLHGKESWTPKNGKKVLACWYSPYSNVNEIAEFENIMCEAGSGPQTDTVFVKWNNISGKNKGSLGLIVFAITE